MAKISFAAEVTFKDFFSKCYQIRTADLVTFTEKILEGKLHFLCRVSMQIKIHLYRFCQEYLHWNFLRFSKAVICQKSSVITSLEIQATF